jgi:hypothetical protein
VSEQFARTVLGIAHYAAIVLHGTITRVGTPVPSPRVCHDARRRNRRVRRLRVVGKS